MKFITLYKTLKSWLAAPRPKKIHELLRVEWDDTTVRVHVAEGMSATWNQEFLWTDITRVCFKDEGAYGSDILSIELRDKEKPAIILTEASNGREFFRQLVRRGLFGKAVFEQAMNAVDRGLYCWPPKEDLNIPQG